jgi:hypothetical protein
MIDAMKPADVKLFDNAVVRFFLPVAAKIKLPLNRLQDGIYEIAAPESVMRIRLGIGHGKSVLATIMATRDRPPDVNDTSKELGLGLISRFHGDAVHTEAVSTEREFLEQAEIVAHKAEEHFVPYLLGLRDDLERAKEYVETLIIESGMREKKWNFPKNVREEWL